jgi:hypothetical protein
MTLLRIKADKSCDMLGGGMRSFIVDFPDVVVDAALVTEDPYPAQVTATARAAVSGKGKCKDASSIQNRLPRSDARTPIQLVSAGLPDILA